VEPTGLQPAVVAAQDEPGQALAPSPVFRLTAIFQPLQRQIDELRQTQSEMRTQQRNVWVAFAAGIVVAAVFFLIIVLLIRAG
jgi:hypothetical protein